MSPGDTDPDVFNTFTNAKSYTGTATVVVVGA
jgi:hypothetical protein